MVQHQPELQQPNNMLTSKPNAFPVDPKLQGDAQQLVDVVTTEAEAFMVGEVQMIEDTTNTNPQLQVETGAIQ